MDTLPPALVDALDQISHALQSGFHVRPADMDILKSMVLEESVHLPAFFDHLHRRVPPNQHFVAVIKCLGWGLEHDKPTSVQHMLQCLNAYDHVHGSHANFDLRFTMRSMLRHGSMQSYPLVVEWARHNLLLPDFSDMINVCANTLSVPMALHLAKDQDIQSRGLVDAMLCYALYRAVVQYDTSAVFEICINHPSALIHSNHRFSMSNLGAAAFEKDDIVGLLISHLPGDAKKQFLTGALEAALRTHNVPKLEYYVQQLRAHDPRSVQDKYIANWMVVATRDSMVQSNQHTATPSSLMPVLLWLKNHGSSPSLKPLLDAAVFQGHIDVMEWCLQHAKPDEETMRSACVSKSSRAVDAVRTLVPHLKYNANAIKIALTQNNWIDQTLSDVLPYAPRKMVLSALDDVLGEPSVVSRMIDHLRQQPLKFFERPAFRKLLERCARREDDQNLTTLLSYHIPSKVWDELKSIHTTINTKSAEKLICHIQTQSDVVALNKAVPVDDAPISRKKKM